MIILKKRKKVVPEIRDHHRLQILAAAETDHLAQHLPDGAAIRIAVGVASKEEHLA